MDLKNLETMRSEYQSNLCDLQVEVGAEILDAAVDLELEGECLPRRRPVDMDQEDINIIILEVFQFQAIPMFITACRDIRDRIIDDNTAAVKLYEVLEYPLRTISTLMKVHKISGNSLEYDNDYYCPLSPMYD